MNTTRFLRGMATVSYWSDDVTAARDWYADLLGVEAYFQQPDADDLAYVEFRIGDDEDELGILDRRYAPKRMQEGPGGAVLLWHVDDIEATYARLRAKGVTAYDRSRSVVTPAS